MIGGNYRLGTVGAHLLVPTIVQQDHVAAANLFCDFTLDFRGWRGVPVVAGDVPHDWLEAKFARHAEHGWTASAERRAEEIGIFAYRILQSRAALLKLAPDVTFAFESEQRMREGVIADDVAGLDNLAGDFRALLYVASDQKKSRLNTVSGENFQQAQGMKIIGTVVVSQGELPRAAL